MHLQIQWCSGTRQPSAVAMGVNHLYTDFLAKKNQYNKVKIIFM